MTRRTDKRPRILKAAFELAVSKGWENTTIEDIAQKAKLPVETLYGYDCSTKKDILALHNGMVDEKVMLKFKELAEQGEYDETTERERLFDLMMMRMETLNDERESLQAILGGSPYKAVIGIPTLHRSMGRMLETAGIESDNPFKSEAKIIGLMGVYAAAVRTWSKEDDGSLNGTMHSLDTNLKKAERYATKFGL